MDIQINTNVEAKNDSTPVDIVFIDKKVEAYEKLIADIKPGTRTILLDPATDGITQITKSLQGGKFKSVHIVSHGSEGSLDLGSTQLKADNLELYTNQLQQWTSVLTEDADILLYGCNVASGEKGKAFVKQLSQMTGADIAASNDLTGSKLLGGDWKLEFETGSIENSLAFTPDMIDAYNYVLKLPGARSATVGGEVFLGGNFLELGINSSGGFGTVGAKPANFSGTNARSEIGMSSDVDGFNEGNDLRIDYFLPGSPEERWVIGYEVGGSTVTASNSSLNGPIDISNTVVDTSSGDILSARSTGTHAGKLEIVQVISFDVNDKFYKNNITLKNVSTTDSLTNVRYMRSFDPDNTVDLGGQVDTQNTVKGTFLEDGYAAVEAKTHDSNDPVFIATGSRAPIVLYSNDPRAVASYFGFSNTNPYDPEAYNSPIAKNTSAIGDIGITLTFDVGTLAPGESTTFTYYTSLDERDFSQVIADIIADAPITINPLRTDDSTPPLSGRVKDPDAIVQVTVDGKTYTANNDGNGTWSIANNVISPPLTTKTYDVKVVATGPLGTFTDETSNELTITSTPVTPTVTVNQLITNDQKPRLSGLVSSSTATINVTVNGQTYAAVNNQDGTWVVPDNTITSNLPEGIYNVQVSATNIAGTRTDTTTNELTIDITPPALSITTVANTSDTTPVIAGTAEANSSITLTINNSGSITTYKTTTNATGEWNIDLGTATPATGTPPILSNGSTVNVSVSAKDAAGNTSTSTQTLIVDTVAPGVPTITSPASTNDTTPTIAGSAEPNSDITLSINNGNSISTYTTTANASGAWSIDLGTATPITGTPPSLADGSSINISVTAKDAAGNTSAAATQTLTIDTTPPVVPTITSTVNTNDTTPVIAGSAEPNSNVTLSINNSGSITTYTVTANASGAWSVDLGTATPATGTPPSLADGSSVNISVSAKDAAGNISAAATQTFVVDTIVPSVPNITSPANTSDTTPVIAGSAEPNSSVTLSINHSGSITTYTATANASGAWSVDLGTATPATGTPPSLANGSSANVSVGAKDAAGNISAAATQSLVIDATAPTAPTITSPANISDITRLISGNAEVGSTITFSVDTNGDGIADVTYETTATGNASWSIDFGRATPTSGTAPTLNGDSVTVSIAAKDAAGNTSAVVNQNVRVDTIAPTPPTITSPTNTNSSTRVISGNAEAGSTINLDIDTNGDSNADVTYRANVDADGNWSIDLSSTTPTIGTPPTFNENNINVSATATDAAGNTSTPTSQTLKIDTTPPNPPSITTPANTNDTTRVIGGTAEIGSTISLDIDANGDGKPDVTYKTTVGTDGNWSIDLGNTTPTTGVAPSFNGISVNVNAIATDVAGNSSTKVSQTFKVKTTSEAPSVILLNAAAITYAEGTPPIFLDNGANVTDSDSANFNTGKLVVSLSTNSTSDDRLTINSSNNEGISIVGNNVVFNNTTIGTKSGGVGITPLVINFNADATPTAVQTLLRNITYTNISTSPSIKPRAVTITLDDGNGGTTTVNKTINVTANNTPVAIKFTEQIGSNNPFGNVDVGNRSRPSLADIDGDGDLDALLGAADGSLRYFQNNGTATNPSFAEQTGNNNPFNGFNLGANAAPNFADIDGDGDLDVIVATNDGTIRYLSNTGTATNPIFTEQTGSNNPFDGINAGTQATVSFGDLDNDGDLDVVMGNKDGALRYLRNNGTATNPSFVEQTGASNPFNGLNLGSNIAPNLADIDGDGDLDVVVGTGDGTVRYLLNKGTNTNPVFAEQIGANNPFNGVNVGANATPYLVDINGDGNLDTLVGAEDGTLGLFVGSLSSKNSNGSQNPKPQLSLTTQNSGILSLTQNNSNLLFNLASFSSSNKNVNEVGVFTVDDDFGTIDGISPNSPGYTEAAFKRAKAIFSSVFNSPQGFDGNLSSILNFKEGQKLAFYVVSDSSTDVVKTELATIGRTNQKTFLSTTNQIKITQTQEGGFNLNWQDKDSLAVSIRTTNEALPKGTQLQNETQKELIDLRTETNQTSTSFTMYREAMYNNTIGFYKVADADGSVVDPLTGKRITATAENRVRYAEVALKNRVSNLDMTVANQNTQIFQNEMMGGAIYAPFIISNGSSNSIRSNFDNVYFSYIGVNSDKTDHIRLLGNNVFGFEDLASGGDKDFNDIIVKINVR